MEVVVRYRKYPTTFSSRSATAATLIFILGSILSMILYPGYSLTEEYLSDLGTGSKSAIIFNATVIFTAIFLVPVFIGIFYGLSRYMNTSGVILLNGGVGLGLISVVYLALVGVYPDTGGSANPHRAVAINFFVLVGLSLFLITLALKASEIDEEEDIHINSNSDYIGFSFVILLMIMTDFSTWYHKLLQKVFVYLSLIFLSYLTSRISDISSEKEFYYPKEKIGKEEAFTLDQVLVNSRVLF